MRIFSNDELIWEEGTTTLNAVSMDVWKLSYCSGKGSPALRVASNDVLSRRGYACYLIYILYFVCGRAVTDFLWLHKILGMLGGLEGLKNFYGRESLGNHI